MAVQLDAKTRRLPHLRLEIPNFPYTAWGKVAMCSEGVVFDMDFLKYVKTKWQFIFPWIKVVAVIAAIAFVLQEIDGPQRYEVSGTARLVDGDSLFIDGLEIRLKSIDAPEGRQNCLRNGKDWRCGEEATRRLRRFINRRPVFCKGDKYDRYNRLLAFCKVAGQEINKWMVKEGWAVAFGSYRREEKSARRGKKGIWSSRFKRPRAWRAENK